MDGWAHRAPYCTDARRVVEELMLTALGVSLVQEEVRRQVHHALENQWEALEDLKLENQRLKMEAVRSAQAQEEAHRTQVGPVVPGNGNHPLQASTGLGVRRSDPLLASTGLGVPGSGRRQASTGLGVPNSGPFRASAGPGVPISDLQ